MYPNFNVCVVLKTEPNNLIYFAPWKPHVKPMEGSQGYWKFATFSRMQM